MANILQLIWIWIWLFTPCVPESNKYETAAYELAPPEDREGLKSAKYSCICPSMSGKPSVVVISLSK
jgi:hypothetical protein